MHVKEGHNEPALPFPASGGAAPAPPCALSMAEEELALPLTGELAPHSGMMAHSVLSLSESWP